MDRTYTLFLEFNMNTREENIKNENIVMTG